MLTIAEADVNHLKFILQSKPGVKKDAQKSSSA